MISSLFSASCSRIAMAVAAALACVSVPLAHAGDLAVDGQWYRPHTDTAYVYVRNTSDRPLTLKQLSVNGRVEEATPWPLDPERKSHWFDFIPAVVPPHGVSQVRVNLRDPKPGEAVELTVTSERGDIKQSVQPQEPALLFSDITFAQDGSAASLFVRGKDFTIQKVMMDGQDVTDRCDLAGAQSVGDVALVTVKPSKHLALGSYHVFEVISADGRTALYAAHTLADKFVLATYGNMQFFQAYKDNALNTFVSFRNLTPPVMDDLKANGLTAAPVPFVGGEYSPKTKEWVPFDEAATRANLAALKANGAVAFYAGTDEPDGYDSMNKNLGMHGRSFVRQRQIAEEVDPAAATFVQIDNSMKPFNYHVYAETMDYSATHRYNLGQEFLAGDREACEQLRRSSQPQPYLWVDQLYPVREKQGERVNYNGRDPLPQEMALQMYEAVANGAKGIVHYIHSGSSGGRGGSGKNAELWNSMKPIHQQLAAVGPIIASSTPTPWASADSSDFRAVALLSDRHNVLVVVTNQAVESTKTGFVAKPHSDVTVTVNLPSWVRFNDAVQALPGGELSPLSVTKQNNQAVIHLTHPELGALIWLRGDVSK